MKFKNDNPSTHFVHYALKASAGEVKDLRRREKAAFQHLTSTGEPMLLMWSLVSTLREARRHARALNIINAWAKGRPFSSAERYRYGERSLLVIQAKAGKLADQIYGDCVQKMRHQQDAITSARKILHARHFDPFLDKKFEAWVEATPVSEEFLDRLIAKKRRKQAA